VSPNLSHGVWYWRVRAQDRAGNDSAPSAKLSFEIDTQAPANPTLASPEDGALVASRTLTLSWNQVADAAAYLVDFSQAADLASYERVEASSTFKGITVAADGDWYWRVLARDAAGNLSDASAAPVIRRVAIDTAAPEVPSLVAVATPTNDNTPTLSWSSVSDAADYVVTLDGSISVVTGTSWAPDPLSDGSHTWTVAARDSAGNRSADAPAQSFVVDATAPGAPTAFAVIPNPTRYSTAVASWSGVVDADGYAIEWDRDLGFGGADYGSATTGATTHTLRFASAGTWYWRVRAFDQVANTSCWSDPESVVYDDEAPALVSFTIDGNGYTSTVAVTARSHATGASHMRLSGDIEPLAGANLQGWVPYSENRAIALTSGDGTKIVNAQFRDLAGNETATVSASVVLDTTDPSVLSVSVNWGAAYTRTRTVSVQIAASLDATEMAVADVAEHATIDCAAAPLTWESFVPAYSHLLSVADGTDGERRKVVVCVRDRVNKTSSNFAHITFDDVAPVPGVVPIEIDGGKLYTRSHLVSLGLSATGASEMYVDGDVEVSDGKTFQWIAYAPSITLVPLSAAPREGIKRVRVRFRDEAGNESQLSTASIHWDQSLPSDLGVEIALSGAGVPATGPTPSRSVDVLLRASDAGSGVANYQISRCSTFAAPVHSCSIASCSDTDCCTVQCPSAAVFSNYLLRSTTQGIKYVYARFQDKAMEQEGLWTSSVSDSIYYDAYPPTFTAFNADAHTSTAQIRIDLSASDNGSGLDAYQIAEDPPGFGAQTAWIPWAGSGTFVLTPDEGVKTLVAKVRDASGRESTTLTATVVLDATPPVIAGFSANRAHVNASSELRFAIAGADNLTPTGQLEMRVGTAAGCSGAGYVAFQADYPYSPTLLQPGANTVRLCLRDQATNTTLLPAEVAVYRDDSSPAAPLLASPSPGSGQVSLAWTAATDGQSGTALYEVRYLKKPNPAPAPVPAELAETAQVYATTDQLQAVVSELTNQTEYWFWVRAIDKSGNPGPFSNRGRATPGWRSSTFASTPAVAEADIDSWDNRLWMLHHTSISYCDADIDDCTVATNWQKGTIVSALSEVEKLETLAIGPRYIFAPVSQASGNPSVFVCDHTAGTCLTPSQWTRVTLSLGASYQRAQAARSIAAVSGDRIQVAYRCGGGFACAIQCFHATNCAQAASWQAVQTDIPVAANIPVVPLQTDELERYFLVSGDGTTAASGPITLALRFRLCRRNVYTCESGAHFNYPPTVFDLDTDDDQIGPPPSPIGATHNGERAYVAYAAHVSGETLLKVTHCRVGTNCYSAAHWSKVLVDKAAGADMLKRAAFQSHNGVLHLVYQVGSSGDLRHAWCAPGTRGDCNSRPTGPSPTSTPT
jgi:hypothetical protein